jgi:hypothetical protein
MISANFKLKGYSMRDSDMRDFESSGETDALVQEDIDEQENWISSEESEDLLKKAMGYAISIVYNEEKVKDNPSLILELDIALTDIFNNPNYKDLLGNTQDLKKKNDKAFKEFINLIAEIEKLRDSNSHPHRLKLFGFFADVRNSIKSLQRDYDFQDSLSYIDPNEVSYIKSQGDTPAKPKPTKRKLVDEFTEEGIGKLEENHQKAVAILREEEKNIENEGKQIQPAPKSKVQDLETINKNLGDKIEKLENQLKEQEKLYQEKQIALEGAVSDLETEKNNLKIELEKVEQLKDSFQNLNTKLIESGKTVKAQNKELDKKLQEKDKQLKNVKNSNEDLKLAQEQNKKLLEEQESLKTQIRQLEEGAELFAKKEEENAQLKQKLEELKQQKTTSPVLNGGGEPDESSTLKPEEIKGPSTLTNIGRSFVCFSSACAIGMLAAPKLFDKGALRFGFEHIISREAVIVLNTVLAGSLISSIKGHDGNRDYKMLVAGLATTVGLAVDAYFRGNKLSAVAAITTAAAAMCA